MTGAGTGAPVTTGGTATPAGGTDVGNGMDDAGALPYIEAGCGPAETVAVANAGSGAPGMPPLPMVTCFGFAGSEGGGGGREGGTPGPDEGPIPGPMLDSTLEGKETVSLLENV